MQTELLLKLIHFQCYLYQKTPPLFTHVLFIFPQIVISIQKKKKKIKRLIQHIQNFIGNTNWEFNPILIFKTMTYHQLMQNHKSFHIFIIPL